MKCPKCQFENIEAAKFCLRCGESLTLRCFKCSKELPLLSKFCDECGQKLEGVLEAEQEMDKAERKYITVLFSDLTGYSEMFERLDSEEVEDITTQIFEKVSILINRYEGFIEKFAGDAVIVFSGAPISHEDDPVGSLLPMSLALDIT